MREFARGREQVEDARPSGRFPDAILYSRIQAALEAMSNASIRQLSEISHYSPSIIFYVVMFVFRLKSRH
jgi:hypothetical protein